MVESFKTVAVLGTGAIGAYYGARLAKAGHQVHFLARNDRMALQSLGLRVDLPGDTALVLPSVSAHGSTAEIGPMDLVLVALKTTANHLLPELLPPLLHENTLVVNLQNGLGGDDAVAAVAGPARTAGALCAINSHRLAPGHIRCTMPGVVSLAEFEGPASERIHALAARFLAAGVKANTAESLPGARWRKLVWNIPFNGLAIAGGGLSTDRILASQTLSLEARELMNEVVAAAAANGVQIPGDFIEKQFASTRGMGAYRPSSLVDFAAGLPVEVEAIWGEPLRRAQRQGSPAPRLSLLYGLIVELCKGAAK